MTSSIIYVVKEGLVYLPDMLPALPISEYYRLYVCIILQKTAFSLVKSSLALGSPACLFVRLFVVTMLKMAKYTEKWLLTAP